MSDISQANGQTTATEAKTTDSSTTNTGQTVEATGGAKSVLDQAIDAAKPTTEAGADGKSTEAKPEPKSGVPEKYADFKLPEGVELSGETLTKATGLFKDLGLDQAGAQRLVDFHTAALREASEGPAKLWQDTQDAWVDELRSDPTIGKGIENGAVGASIAKMIAALPAPQAASFREAMNFTGAGNNPAIVRGFYELSKRFAEPGHVQGNAPAQVKSKPSAAQALYPTLSPKE